MSIKKIKVSEMTPLPDSAGAENIFIPSADVVAGKSYRISLKRAEGLSIYTSSYAATKTTAAISLSTIAVPEGRSVKVGDLIIANGTYSYMFRVTAVSPTTATVTYKTSLRGEKGDKGDDGDDGSLGSSDLDDAIYSYGVYHDDRNSAPECVRVGNMELHRTLPIHSKMRGCLLDDDGNVVKYLDADDWTEEVRDGSQGQVMVEIPEHYRKFSYDDGKVEVRISENPLEGYHKVPLMYVSAYEASLYREDNILCSVVNTSEEFRGGQNKSEWDNTYRSLLGRPVTSINLAKFRTYARQGRGDSTKWNCMTYEAQKAIYWLFVIEYATLNSQADYTPELTTEGYRKGGLGSGVTNLNDSKWNTFNLYNPFIPCGYTDSLGNNTGVVAYEMPEEYDDAGLTTYVPRYRGIENPFGHIFQWTDGILVNKLDVYTSNDPDVFSSSAYTNYTYKGKISSVSGSYIKSILGGEEGDIIGDTLGGSSNTYFCDTITTNPFLLTAVAFGGCASNGARAGFVFAYASAIISNALASVGSRLCFHP